MTERWLSPFGWASAIFVGAFLGLVLVAGFVVGMEVLARIMVPPL